MFPALVLEVDSDSGLHYTTPGHIGGSAEHIYFFQYAILGTVLLISVFLGFFTIEWATQSKCQPNGS